MTYLAWCHSFMEAGGQKPIWLPVEADNPEEAAGKLVLELEGKGSGHRRVWVMEEEGSGCIWEIAVNLRWEARQ